jgi:hypothetical protein
MKRLLAVSLLVAAVLVPAALAKTTAVPKPITVASSSAVTPSGTLTISKQFSPVPRGSITVVTSGPVNDVRVRTSACYRKSGQDVISTARDDRPGRLAVGYDHTTTRCTIIASAEASSAKPGRTIKIAIQIER